MTSRGLAHHLNKLHIVLIDGFRRGKVFAAGREGVAGFHNDVLVVEVGQDGHEEPSVPVVRHAAAIVTLAGQVSDGLERHLLVSRDKQLGAGRGRIGNMGSTKSTYFPTDTS